MRHAPGLGYWLRRPHVVGYSPFREVLKLDEARTRIVESAHLDDLFTREERIAALKEGSAPSLELMLTLSYADELARESVAGRDR
jgi:hypothetical protein